MLGCERLKVRFGLIRSGAVGLRVLEFRVVDGLFYHKGGRILLFYDC